MLGELDSSATAAVAEREVITSLALRPALRKNFVAAAEFFDIIGDEKTASSLYNGVVPRWLVGKYNLEKFTSKDSQYLPCCIRVGWYPAHSENIEPPINTDRNRNSVFDCKSKNIPFETVDVLEGGSFVYDGISKLYVDPDNIRVLNHSNANSYLTHSLSGDIRNATQWLTGTSILLAASNANNFYHWHFDILPALSLLEAAGITIADIDNIVLTKQECSFHLEMLKLLGVRDNQIKVIEPGYEHVRCERLLLPTVRNGMGLRQPRKHIDWIRSKFLPCIGPIEPLVKGKIAIVRDQRGYTNPDMVSEFFLELGYTLYKPEQHSYLEQVSAFHNASHIVSPHGAGLALLAYCMPGTIVHEFYGDHVHPCFWSLSNALGLKYHNYNCGEINQAEITNSGRGMRSRLQKKIDLGNDILNELECI